MRFTKFSSYAIAFALCVGTVSIATAGTTPTHKGKFKFTYNGAFDGDYSFSNRPEYDHINWSSLNVTGYIELDMVYDSATKSYSTYSATDSKGKNMFQALSISDLSIILDGIETVKTSDFTLLQNRGNTPIAPNNVNLTYYEDTMSTTVSSFELNSLANNISLNGDWTYDAYDPEGKTKIYETATLPEIFGNTFIGDDVMLGITKNLIMFRDSLSSEVFLYSNTNTMDSSFEMVSMTAVPEPATLGILATGGILALARRRRKKSA